MRILVVSDTHIGRDRRRRLPDALYAELERSDAVLHAGDVVVPEVLHELEGFAPTWAVLGNNDGELLGLLPERRVVELGGLRVAMVHDAGPRAGREGRLRRRFPDAPVVVFGHSHRPVDAAGLDGQRLFNPGSPTTRRTAAVPLAFGRLVVDDGRLVAHAIVPLD